MFLNTLIQTLLKMAVLAMACLLGILAGKKLRDSKDAKAESKA